MAGWDREANWSRDVLERIVALLFSLADLAGLAAGAPCLRRRQVLAILSYGEAEARAFLIGTAAGAPAPADAPGEPADAERLAARLRALALLLCALLAQAALFALPGTAVARIDRRRPAELAGRQAVPPAPDTS